MADTSTRVLVAVDAAASATDAVEWAAAEAGARGLGLRIVHVLRPTPSLDPSGFDTYARLRTAAAVAVEVLESAMDRARLVDSDLPVDAALLRGPAIRTLSEAALSAPLLVVGRRNRSATRRLLSPSVAGRLAARTPCPVVVVRHRELVPMPAPPRVVVGVTPGPAGLAAVEFGFTAAAQRGVPLALVHVTPEDATLNALAGVPHGSPATTGEAAVRDPEIRAAITAGQQQFPDLDVSVAGPVGDAATVLLRESAGAALLVLGSAGRSPRRPWDLRSVGQRLLPAAQCPVAVVGSAAARTRLGGGARGGQSRSPADARKVL
ncbi:universal stress protein [Sporichthya polymorpha]|uniref:universal stress protein n=1 Tax=Sporichthya polymorpha TaxID=35751 RepID=UPI0003A4C65E|nr:universal stress protein [Sporichthya polymorpha]